jgi:hypothetical protein
VNFATSASLTRAASTVTAMARFSASARPTGVATSAIKVRKILSQELTLCYTTLRALNDVRNAFHNKCHDDDGDDLTYSNRLGIYHSRNELKVVLPAVVRKEKEYTEGWVFGIGKPVLFSIPIIIKFVFFFYFFSRLTFFVLSFR